MRLTCLAKLSIENKVAEAIDFNDVIDDCIREC